MVEKGMIAIVTGGAQGIGRSICISLANRGVIVYSLDVKEDRNAETARLMKAVSPKSEALYCDVSNPESIDKVFDQIIAEAGTVDILVNNAAIFSTFSFVNDSYETALTDWENNMDTNARSTLLCSKKVAKIMADKGSGEILNIITNHLKRQLFPASDSEHSYDASKYAQLALNESLDCELKKYGVRVNALCPAATRSPMLQEFFDSIGVELTKEKLGEVSGHASLLECEEVAETACQVLNWDKNQPTGQAYLLMFSEDCEELKKGHVQRLADSTI